MRRSPPPPSLSEAGDATFDDFAAGQGDDGLHLWSTRSAVTLAPAVAGEFDGPGPPPGWSVESTTQSGSARFGPDGVALDGAGIWADGLIANGRAVEFRATFARRPNQHAGLGVDFVHDPWVSFSTKFGNALYARTNFYLAEDERVSADLLGASHRYRIDWNVIDIVFAVDGERAAHLLVPVPGFMRPGAANTNEGREPLVVKWMLVTPYRPVGRFLSRGFDGGRRQRWDRVGWEADLPPGTAVSVDVRAGDRPEPDPSWSPWVAVTGPGMVGPAGRYAQYRAELRTADPHRTPVLRGVTLDARAGRD